MCRQFTCAVHAVHMLSRTLRVTRPSRTCARPSPRRGSSRSSCTTSCSRCTRWCIHALHAHCAHMHHCTGTARQTRGRVQGGRGGTPPAAARRRAQVRQLWRPDLLTTQLATHYLLLIHYSLLTTHCSLLTTHYSLLTVHCSLLTAHYSLQVADSCGDPAFTDLIEEYLGQQIDAIRDMNERVAQLERLATGRSATLCMR